MLKIGAAGAVALLLLDQFVIEPGFARWNEQSERIGALRTEVTKGQKLLGREICLVVLQARTTDFDDLLSLVPDLLGALEITKPGDVVRIGVP